VKSAAEGYHFYKPAGLFTISTAKLGPERLDEGEHTLLPPHKGIVAKIEKSLGH
jgi:hypothetical protein